ncbi:PIF1-like helicase-domain-containing protein, partial [Dactylonectria macrodidyma]
LRLVQGIQYQTYQEAAIALGLFQDICEATYAIEEAIASYSRPSQLRFLFAYLLLDFPSPAIQIWDQFHSAMSADFDLHYEQQEAQSRTLQSISRILRGNGATLKQYGLPEPAIIERELNIELDAFASQREELLARSHRSYDAFNADQRHVFDTIYSAIPEGGCFFIDGKAGRGKTFLVQALCDRIRGEGQLVCITGSTALSVTLYDRGRTAHSMFGIPVRENSTELISSIRLTSPRAELLYHASFILWEELPMANKAAVECADELLRNITNDKHPFGNKTFIGIGDFRQVAPVTPATTAPAAVFDSSIRSSSLWPHFQILRLTTPIRTASDPLYSDWLDKVGGGIPPHNTEVALDHLGEVDSLQEAVDFLFPDETTMNLSQSVLRSFLSPFNMQVDEFNDLMLKQLPGNEGYYP